MHVYHLAVAYLIKNDLQFQEYFTAQPAAEHAGHDPGRDN
jgi:hypothetical protein